MNTSFSLAWNSMAPNGINIFAAPWAVEGRVS